MNERPGENVGMGGHGRGLSWLVWGCPQSREMKSALQADITNSAS